MVNIYRTDKNKAHKVEEKNIIEEGCWIEMTNPIEEELEMVAKKTGANYHLLNKLLDDEELPRIEEEEGSTLIVLDTPYLANNNFKHKYNTYPIGLILHGNYFISISVKELDIFNDFKAGRIKEFDIKKRTKFVIQVLLKIAGVYQHELKAINEDMNQKEKTLCKSTNNKELISLLDMEKTLTYFITSLKANDVVLEKLGKKNVIPMYEDDIDLLDDASIENKQAIEMANIYKDILTSMTDTYATIISNNLNDVMKFLAAITIVFSIPTMISSMLGMNVFLGDIATSPYSFIIIIGISILLSLLIAWWFKRKNML